MSELDGSQFKVDDIPTVENAVRNVLNCETVPQAETNHARNGYVRNRASENGAKDGSLSKRHLNSQAKGMNGNVVPPREHNETLNLSPGVPGISIATLGSFMLLWPPLFVWFFWLACDSYQCSLGNLAHELWTRFHDLSSVLAFVRSNIPAVTPSALKLYSFWMILQVVLFLVLPGKKARGQITPAGNVLSYKCNGLNAWVLSHVFFLAAVKFGVLKASAIADDWGPLIVLANVFGFSLSAFSYLKALHFPTHPEDRCFSGSSFYDFFMGVEMNPRIGNFDFKLFFNGRPGIVAWTLIDISFAAKQYNELGYVTNAMILLNILHAIYVIDFFMNEAWYLRTIDMAHDHFGFYLAWGDSVWLPVMYTIQSCYLAYNPVVLPWWGFAGVLVLGLAGYAIFRATNSQKDYFRSEMKKNGKCVIWGKPARYVSAVFSTSSGDSKETCLLASGWWGISRHFNYVGDLMNSLSYCLTCGFGHVLPYFYIIFMTILLVHRSFRDDIKCRQKYGAFWEKYCRLVPYKIIPYVF